MKKVKWIMVLMVAGFIFSGDAFAECEPGEERETKTGAVFTCDDSYPDLGEAWRDESGLIWGDTVKNEDGSVRKMVQSSEYMREFDSPAPDEDGELGAEEYCKSLKDSDGNSIARLPSKVEFIRLRKRIVDRSRINGKYIYRDDKILPNLKGYEKLL